MAGLVTRHDDGCLVTGDLVTAADVEVPRLPRRRRGSSLAFGPADIDIAGAAGESLEALTDEVVVGHAHHEAAAHAARTDADHLFLAVLVGPAHLDDAGEGLGLA